MDFNFVKELFRTGGRSCDVKYKQSVTQTSRDTTSHESYVILLAFV